ncbi:MAG: hypothetical protein J4432_02840 [DPANN group archaeon]|nr:hypothetical protein [DPANN group archaeon]
MKSLYSFEPKQVDITHRDQFEVRIIFELIKALKPQEINITSTDLEGSLRQGVFNPTLTQANIKLSLLQQDYSVWYKPVFFLPGKSAIVDLVMLRGHHDSLYMIDDVLKKTLAKKTKLTAREKKVFINELLRTLKPIHMMILAKKRFYVTDSAELSLINSVLKPSNLLLISEKEVPMKLKMMLPKNVHLVEKADINHAKFVDAAMKLI